MADRELKIASSKSTYIPPTDASKITLEGPGAGKYGLLFTKTELAPELQKLAYLIIEVTKPSYARDQDDGKEVDGASGSTGVPSDADLNMLLGEIDNIVTGAKYAVAKAGVGVADIQREGIRKKLKDAAEAITTKLAAAVEAAGKSNLVGWISAIAMTVGAIALCAATVIGGVLSGGAGFVAIFACVAAVGMAVQMITDMSLKEAGTQYTACTGETKQLDVSMNGMVDAIVDRQIVDGTIIMTNDDGKRVDYNGNVIKEPDGGRKSTALVMTQDELSDWKMGWSIAAMVIVALSPGGVSKAASLFAKIFPKVGAEAGKAADIGAKAAKTAEMWGKVERGVEILAVSAGVVGGISAISKGIIDLSIAELGADTEKARATQGEDIVREQDASKAWDFAMDYLQSTVTQFLQNAQGRAKNVGDRGRISGDFARAVKA